MTFKQPDNDIQKSFFIYKQDTCKEKTGLRILDSGNLEIQKKIWKESLLLFGYFSDFV